MGENSAKVSTASFSDLIEEFIIETNPSEKDMETINKWIKINDEIERRGWSIRFTSSFSVMEHKFGFALERKIIIIPLDSIKDFLNNNTTFEETLVGILAELRAGLLTKDNFNRLNPTEEEVIRLLKEKSEITQAYLEKEVY